MLCTITTFDDGLGKYSKYENIWTVIKGPNKIDYTTAGYKFSLMHVGKESKSTIDNKGNKINRSTPVIISISGWKIKPIM